MIWHEGNGEGTRTVLLLHGVGATAAVWHGLARQIEARGLARSLAADLPGHGGSDWRPSYSVGEMAGELAELARGAGELYIVGHSLGVYVALALASGWFGVRVRATLGIGPKIAWPDADLAAARELAARPVRHYPSAEEAWLRYRRIAGLTTELAPGEDALARGITRDGEGWRLAQDPRTFAVAGAPFASLAASAAGPVWLARGERDPLVSAEELRRHGSRSCEIGGAGHNAHLEQPGAIASLLEELMAG
ncbi:MAG TPA: alpha/beta hydrolase [Steroidobacteraceae bacterium]|nr:alpha/beta hydrolase [Steroidobacteraceae bacterium]